MPQIIISKSIYADRIWAEAQNFPVFNIFWCLYSYVLEFWLTTLFLQNIEHLIEHIMIDF